MELVILAILGGFCLGSNAAYWYHVWLDHRDRS